MINQPLCLSSVLPLFKLLPNCNRLTCWQSNAKNSPGKASTYLNQRIPDVQGDLENAEEPKIKLPTSIELSKKQENSRKISTSALLSTLKPLTVWITKNCGKFWKRWEYQTLLLASWEICMQVKKQRLEPDTEQQTGSKLGKEYVKAVYCHPVYLTSLQSTSWEMLGWKKHKLESRLLVKNQ